MKDTIELTINLPLLFLATPQENRSNDYPGADAEIQILSILPDKMHSCTEIVLNAFFEQRDGIEAELLQNLKDGKYADQVDSEVRPL